MPRQSALVVKSEDLFNVRMEPSCDPRNKLNDLDNVQWLISTKSVWESRPPPRDELKEQHPATFAENDVEKLIRFFTKKEGKVLDPFLGSGSTLIGCFNTGRDGVGVELAAKWVNIARKRIQRSRDRHLQAYVEKFAKKSTECLNLPDLRIFHGDARDVLKKFDARSFDFIVTSPPYWSILRKARDHKSVQERLNKGLPTRYSEDKRDLGNSSSYEGFLKQLAQIFAECHRLLRKGKYMAVIVSDFRHGSKFIPFHADLAHALDKIGFSLEGITILIQDSKNLYPYGMPYAFVSNIHHQYILIFRRS